MKKFVEKYGVLSAKIMTVLSALSYIIYKFIELLSS
jgi:hypothetical protein